MTADNEDNLSVGQQNAENIRAARLLAEQQAEATLREQANLLNLTHDAILVRDMKGTVKYWNRGAEELYGWPAEQAVGSVSQLLLKTIFPAPLEQIEEEVIGAGRWEGELVQTKNDGSQIVVASRWSLQRDEKSAPVAILVTNNDVTKRKRAEEVARRSAPVCRIRPPAQRPYASSSSVAGYACKNTSHRPASRGCAERASFRRRRIRDACEDHDRPTDQYGAP
jgi:PAS domain S-box-containing protein